MNKMKLAITIIQLLCGIALTAIVLFQSGKSSGLSGAISGSSDSYSFGANAKSKTTDAKLAKWTKWVALAFVLLTLILNLIH
jgi:preprotein translocase subunit SecG